MAHAAVYITFEHTAHPVPRDTDPNADAPPGRALAEELAAAMARAGLPLASAVTDYEAYGWEFTVRALGREVWFMLQASDEWLLISDVQRTLLEKVRRLTFADAHQTALTVVTGVMGSSPYRSVRVLTRDEFEARDAGA